MLTVEQFAKTFDMAVLKQDTQEAAIREGARTARQYNLAAYYTNPCWSKAVVEELKGSDVLPGAGVGFPYGTTTARVKAFEIDDNLAMGCKTVDMLIDIGALKDKNYALTTNEVKTLVDKCHAAGALAKVILEVGLLNDEEIAAGAKICCDNGVDYIKTSTGTDVPPDVHDLEVIRANLSGDTKMKLSGVPRQFTLGACLWMIDMGVKLIGTRSAAKLVDQYKKYLETRK